MCVCACVGVCVRACVYGGGHSKVCPILVLLR